MIPGYLSGQLRDRPQIAPYQWRARTYPHAVTAIERAETQHGEPYPVCLCGGRMLYGNGHGSFNARCETCGEPPR